MIQILSEKSSWAEYFPILKSDLEFRPLKPPGVVDAALLAHEQKRIEDILKGNGIGFASDHALVILKSLPWDTQHFGIECADLFRFYRLPEAESFEIDALIDAVFEEVKHRKVQFLSARVQSHQADLVYHLEKRGFLLMDTSVELGAAQPLCCKETSTPNDTNINLRRGCPEDRDILCTIASSFTQNRFFRDPRFSKERARSLYLAWVTSALEKRHGELAVVEKEGDVAGFASFIPAEPPLHVGIIGLVAMHPHFRG